MRRRLGSCSYPSLAVPSLTAASPLAAVWPVARAAASRATAPARGTGSGPANAASGRIAHIGRPALPVVDRGMSQKWGVQPRPRARGDARWLAVKAREVCANMHSARATVARGAQWGPMGDDRCWVCAVETRLLGQRERGTLRGMRACRRGTVRARSMGWPRAEQLGAGAPAAALAPREARKVALDAVETWQQQRTATTDDDARGLDLSPCTMKMDINWCSRAGSTPTKVAPRAGRQAAWRHQKGAATAKRRRRRPDGCGPTRIPTTTGGLRTMTREATEGTERCRMLMQYPTPANCGGSLKSTPRRSATWKREEATGPRLRRCARRGTLRKRAGGGPRPQLPCPSAWTGRRQSSAKPRRLLHGSALNWIGSTRKRIAGERSFWGRFARQRVGTNGASSNSMTFTTRRPTEPQGVAGGGGAEQ